MPVVTSAGAGGAAGRVSFVKQLLQRLRGGHGLKQSFGEIARNPIVLLILLRCIDVLWRWWQQQRRLRLGKQRVLCTTSEVDGDVIQGCILSTEHLLSLGRVEKRTLFCKSLLEVMGGNDYLVQEILKAAEECGQRSSNCMVMRWMPPDERYHALQSCLNIISSLFGAQYVHFNALDGENTNLFKSTWYVLTVTLPCRPQNASNWTKSESQAAQPDSTCTFTDMTRKPRSALRLTIINESELRRIADDKLRPPKWGFFNERHAERYRMLVDIARNFQTQLMRHPSDNKSGVSSRSPFTSEGVHAAEQQQKDGSHKESPDGGLIKRVQSQPNLAQASGSLQDLSRFGRNGKDGQDPGSPDGGPLARASRRRKSWFVEQDDGGTTEGGHQADSNNCFLRLHVPHYTGPSTMSTREQAFLANLPADFTGGSSHDLLGPRSSEGRLGPRQTSAQERLSAAAATRSPGDKNFLRANSQTIR